MTEKILLAYFLFMNVAAFLLYGIDKWKAIENAWRISEATLLSWAFLGGSLGAYAAMHIFRHKTRHKKFTILVPLCLALHAAALLYFYFYYPF